MAKFFTIALTVALAVAVAAEPLRYRRQTEELIASAGAVAAEGAGWAADNHQEAVIATGIPGSSSGWGADSSAVPASIVISSQGLSEVGNAGQITEITSNDGAGQLVGAQQVEVEQVALGENALAVDAIGGDVALASASDAIAQGQGSSAAAGTLDILVQPVGSAGWGMAKP